MKKKLLYAGFLMAVSLCLASCGDHGSSVSSETNTSRTESRISSAETASTDIRQDQTEEAGQDKPGQTEEADYLDALFDTSYVHDVKVEISEEDWADLLANAVDKPKYNIKISIDGESYEDVRFSTKGSSSLYLVAGRIKNNRYSFKLRFDYKDKEQTYHGLREISLNNSYKDYSYLRDYAAALAFRTVGVDPAAMSFTRLYINGDYYGLYMAEENIGQEYLDRNYGGEGLLYKPESEVVNGCNKSVKSAVKEYLASGSQDPLKLDLVKLDPNYTTKGADLKYSDDDPENYSDIFKNDIIEVTDQDQEELISALKHLSEGEIDEAIDREEVLRYFAAHNFVCNSDGYTGTALHNYLLYENNGLLAMVPWDYNLSAMPSALRPVTGSNGENSMEELVNQGLDTPTFEEVKAENRPMLNWIYQDEDAYETYEQVMTDELAAYFESDAFTEEMQRVHDLIQPWVERDPTAFCSAEEFEEEYENLLAFYQKRSQSIRKQVAGDLSKNTADQEQEDRISWE